MGLTASRLASHLLTDHISIFPDAIDVYRENVDTGVPLHVPMESFYTAVGNGVVAALAGANIQDVGKGSDDTQGSSEPTRFTFPAASRAETRYLTQSSWNGEHSEDLVSVYIGSVLAGVEKFGRLDMRPHKGMGTGTAHVRPSANPELESFLSFKLQKELTLAFQATGKFAEGDVPGNPINQTLADILDTYAKALAVGFASITATVSYTGVGGGSPVADVVNTGGIV